MEALADIHDHAALADALGQLVKQEDKILADPAQTTLDVADALKSAGAALIETSDPCSLLKARKNAIELNGARTAHVRDGAALCRFLAWLDAEAPSGAITEIAASDRLEAFRRETKMLEDWASTRFPALAPTAPSSITAPRRRRTRRWKPACSI